MNRKASHTVAGAANEGQYHLGYRTEEMRAPSPPPFFRGERQRLAPGTVGTTSVLAAASLPTGLDLVPWRAVQGVDRRLDAEDERARVEVARHDDGLLQAGRDHLGDELRRVDRGRRRLVPVPVGEVCERVRLVEHEVDELVGQARALRA